MGDRHPGSAQRLRGLIREGAPRKALAFFLDALSQEDRVAAVRGLSRADLARFFDLAGTDSPAATEVTFLVPDSTPQGSTVEWMGLNSLPLFRKFTKRFTRSADPRALVGQNTGAGEPFVGPGYFTVVVRPGHSGELLMDYTRLPESAPRGWPALRRNEAGLSRFVFAGMHDYFRPVGAHVGVGAAYDSRGKFKGQYFALARGPLLPIGN